MVTKALKTALILAIVSLVAGQSPTDECCLEKIVGGVEYRYVKELPVVSSYNCLNDCIYERVDNPGRKYCFARGDLDVECEDEDGGVTGVTSPPGGGSMVENGEAVTTTSEPVTSTTIDLGSSTTSEEEDSGGRESDNSTALECNRVCGLKTEGKRIVGGEAASVNEYPWMAGLYKEGEEFPSCGGALINSRWIISAGHCISWSFVLTRAVLGEHDVKVQTETQIRIERSVIKRIRHPDYDDNTLENDLSLFKMDESVNNQIYTPVCMPPPGNNYFGEQVWVTGWGTTTEGGSQAEVLQELELDVVEDQTCYDAMTGALGTYWGKTFPEKQICAGGNQGFDSCQGDSGGPLLFNRTNIYELAGVVSWGMGCARAGVYGVYTEVDNYLPWIAGVLTTEAGYYVTSENITCV